MLRLQIYTIALMAFTAACTPEQEIRNCSGSTWSTTYNITYKASSDLTDSILATFARVDQSLSPFSRHSLISRINRNESDLTDTLIRRIFTASQEISRLSEGAFDPTVSNLVNLWGFGYDNAASPPTKDIIDSALTSVGISHCSLNGTRLVKHHPETEFNFSAITKGYACDLIGEMLSRNGVSDYMVEIGGEIALKGLNPRGEPWHIQIDAPVSEPGAPSHQAMTVIEISNCGIATSGNYRNYHETPIGRTWHTIDPRTGRPALTSTISATVIADDCMTADALATACMAMPPECALRMIESVPGASALFVKTDRDNRFSVLTTSRFPDR